MRILGLSLSNRFIRNVYRPQSLVLLRYYLFMSIFLMIIKTRLTKVLLMKILTNKYLAKINKI